MATGHSGKMFQQKETLTLSSHKYDHFPIDAIMLHKPKFVDLSTNYLSEWPSQNILQKIRELETLVMQKN